MNVPLSASDRETLKKLHKGEKIKKSADRIKAILLLDAGYTRNQISEILLIDEDTITNWSKKFKSSINLSKFLTDNHVDYQGKLTKEQIMLVKQHINKNIITDSKQLIAFIKEQFNIIYSESGVQSLLNSLGFSYKQLTLFPSKSDITKQKEFQKKYKKLKENLLENDVILFMDGVHPQHNTRATKAWIQAGSQKYLKTNTGRKRINLNGLYNPENQDVIIREDDTINADSNIELFKTAKEQYKDAENIYIIADNARYNHAKRLKNILKYSNIQMIYLPPYSPNLNLIERLWKFMRKTVINTMYYEKFSAFRQAIWNFFDSIDQYKDELKKFIGETLHLLEPPYEPKTNLG